MLTEEPAAQAVLDEVRWRLPESARLLDRGATRFLAFVLSCTPTGVAPLGAGAFRALGAAEMRATGDLDRLHRALTAGARRALPVLVRSADFAGAVERLLAGVDAVARLASEGARAAAAGDRGRARARLLAELGKARPAALDELARQAGWRLPDTVVAVALDVGELRTVDGVLCDSRGPEPWAVLPAAVPVPDFGVRAAIGPEVAPEDTARSLRWARRTLRLLRRGVLPDTRAVRWDDHLTTHWLLADDVLRSALETSSLAPLEVLTRTARERAAETLLAFLTTSGSAPEIAGILGVHPQTVRNRLRTLTALFGDRLHDPEERFGLEISLRARKLRPAG
ncbi:MULTISPECIES: helix-turn-helix domain-containing protein [unclassified Amycolatopsis]|uniref:helix-turn-helix domain-containing protein n=1 Tax=unclassified Amycolatopsis TaxID=2618356 RepID=UPI00106ED178|nr:MULTISPECIES: helix-turn-helix domain-containing protein [unclassified Amycolatopsis]